ICQSADGRLWITTNQGALNVFTPGSKIFYHYNIEDKNRTETLNQFPCFITYDVSGKIWIYNNFFVDAIDLLPEKFHLYEHDQKNKSSLSSNIVNSIYE